MAQRERGNSGARAGSGRGDRRRTPEVTRPEPRSLSGPELAQLRGRLLSIVEPVVRSADLDLEDFAVTRAGRRFVVRVTVDGEAWIGHAELTDEEIGEEFADTADDDDESADDDVDDVDDDGADVDKEVQT